MQTIDEKEVEDKLKEQFEAVGKNFDNTINIAIVGRVSTGKSSLLNAFFKRKKGDELAPVGAISGVTKTTKAFQLSKNVTIIAHLAWVISIVIIAKLLNKRLVMDLM